jgi:hypothetical protein
MTDEQIIDMFSFFAHAATMTALADARALVLLCMVGHWT